MAIATTTVATYVCEDDGEEENDIGGPEGVIRVFEELQKVFVGKLERIELSDGTTSVGKFRRRWWSRGERGKYGGGCRYEITKGDIFNRASVNFSHVDYTSREKYPIDSATAFSVILHPQNPHAPSMHFHVSYMEPRGKAPYWRMIADLNPAIVNDDDTQTFELAMRGSRNMSPRLADRAEEFGRRYFYIPALQRHRGAAHFFVGKIDDDVLDRKETIELAQSFAENAIDAYVSIVQNHVDDAANVSDLAAQLAYHTTYTFQVLTLDRGTTHGLLAHADNDVGTLGSLPSYVDLNLLRSWKSSVSSPQDELLDRVIEAIEASDPDATNAGGVCDISEETRERLGGVVRGHYRAHGKRAIRMQADLDMEQWAGWMREDRTGA